jgi:hypothetical protein
MQALPKSRKCSIKKERKAHRIEEDKQKKLRNPHTVFHSRSIIIPPQEGWMAPPLGDQIS